MGVRLYLSADGWQLRTSLPLCAGARGYITTNRRRGLIFGCSISPLREGNLSGESFLDDFEVFFIDSWELFESAVQVPAGRPVNRFRGLC